jgi:DNA-binding MarR family transcriptional regulator
MGKDVENHIGYYITRISHDINVWQNENLKHHGITLSQVRVLNCLWEKDGLTQTEVQNMLNIKPSSLSGLVDTLMGKGFVRRIEDEQDARINRLYLTKSGKELKVKTCDDLYEFEAKLSQGFSPEEKSLLLMWMRKVMNNIKSKP